MHKLTRIALLVVTLVGFSTPALADRGDKHGPSSTSVKIKDWNPAPQDTVLLQSGYFSVDTIEEGPLDLNLSDEQCPKGTHAYLDFSIQDAHINESGNTQGYYTKLKLEESGDGYKVTGHAYEVDDSPDRPHDWVGINWKIWCTVDKVDSGKKILSPRIREGDVYGSTPDET